MSTSQQILSLIDQRSKKEFESNRRILNFDEYLHLLSESPEHQTRGSAQYMVDMLDHYGKVQITPETLRFKLFDLPVDGIAPKVVGQEIVQTQIYQSLKSFARQRMNNKLLLLHGPNGSAKTTTIHALMGGLERYSHEPQGALYTFNWIFPIERYTKGGIGIQPGSYSGAKENLVSYAHLPDDEIAAKIPSDLKDHPLLLIPREYRKELLVQLLGVDKGEKLWHSMPTYLTEGDLEQRSKEIFEALHIAYRGDFKKLLMHVQVERIYHSRRYRKNLASVEPQLHVDAQYQMLSYNKIASLPASLQSLNLFTLTGDLVDSNRGMIEYNDLLKRPIDTFKYLLVACETGAVNVGSTIAHLDTVMLGSTNELQLDAFKEFPDFSSFKARIELIRTPYLLSVTQEREIYELILPQVAAGEKPAMPHTAWSLALWSVLTRLKKPNAINYAPNVSSIVSALTPLDKAKLYDTGEMPVSLTPDDRKLLRSSIRKLREEYSNIPYYEGRLGASVREIKTILFDAMQDHEYKTLSPLPVFRAMESFVKRVSEYEFLKQDVKDHYHDAAEFINVVREEYLNLVDREVRDCIGLYDSAQWEEFMRKYVIHTAAILRKEKIKNQITGKMEDPDQSLITEFEKIVEAPKEGPELQAFRNNIISQIGAWKLDHQQEAIVYSKVFPEYWSKIEHHYFESQKSLLKKMHDALHVYGTDQDDRTSEGSRLARQTIENMKTKVGYTDEGAKEVIGFLMSKRYS